MRKLAVVLLISLILLPVLVSAVKLTIWCGGGTERKGLEAVVAEYKKLNPDVEIELVDVPYSSYEQKIRLGILSGDLPDLVTITYPYAPGYMQYMLDLRPYIQKYLGITPDDFLKSLYDVVRIRITTNEGEIKYVPLHFTA
jgi:alpha-1,4-digalacturonate transport system substrate-binding protein